MLKNNIQTVLVENGIHLAMEEKDHCLSSKNGIEKVKKYALSAASEISVRSSLELLWRIEEEKEKIHHEILLA